MEREFVIHVNTLHNYTSIHYKSCHKYRNRNRYAINTYWDGPFTRALHPGMNVTLTVERTHMRMSNPPRTQ